MNLNFLTTAAVTAWVVVNPSNTPINHCDTKAFGCFSSHKQKHHTASFVGRVSPPTRQHCKLGFLHSSYRRLESGQEPFTKSIDGTKMGFVSSKPVELLSEISNLLKRTANTDNFIQIPL